MTGAISRTLRSIRDTLLREPVSPRVDTPEDINAHYCRFVAETAFDRLGDEYDLQIVEDGGRGFSHVWLVHEGRHYDAECVEGVDDPSELPFFRRHPEAAVHVEPGTADQAAIRDRGKQPLYPDL